MLMLGPLIILPHLHRLPPVTPYMRDGTTFQKHIYHVLRLVMPEFNAHPKSILIIDKNIFIRDYKRAGEKEAKKKMVHSKFADLDGGR